MSRTRFHPRAILSAAALTAALLGTACSDSTAPTTGEGATGASPKTQLPGGTAAASVAPGIDAASAQNVALVPSLQAASTTPTPGDFSPYVAKSKGNYTVDDCTVEVGWLWDSQPAPNWRHWGGVRVNCATRHSVIDATVALFYWNGSRWVQYGVSNYGIRYNQFGSGTGMAGILRTFLPQYCAVGLRQYYWIVSATVRTERTGWTVSTTPIINTREGC